MIVEPSSQLMNYGSIIFSVQWSIQFWAFAIIRIDGFHGNKDLNIENYRNIYGWIIKILKTYNENLD